MIKKLTRESFEALINQCSTTKYSDIFILNIFCRDEETQQLFWNRIKELTAPYEIKSFIDLGRGIVIPKYNNIGDKIIVWPYRDSYPRDMKSTHCIFDWECSYKDVMMNFLYNNTWGNDDAFCFSSWRIKGGFIMNKCNYCLCKTCAIAYTNGGAPGCGDCDTCKKENQNNVTECLEYYNPVNKIRYLNSDNFSFILNNFMQDSTQVPYIINIFCRDKESLEKFADMIEKETQATPQQMIYGVNFCNNKNLIRIYYLEQLSTKIGRSNCTIIDGDYSYLDIVEIITPCTNLTPSSGTYVFFSGRLERIYHENYTKWNAS